MEKNKNINDVDVVIATPPFQGMFIFNHKKNETEMTLEISGVLQLLGGLDLTADEEVLFFNT